MDERCYARQLPTGLRIYCRVAGYLPGRIDEFSDAYRREGCKGIEIREGLLLVKSWLVRKHMVGAIVLSCRMGGMPLAMCILASVINFPEYQMIS